MRRKVNEWWQRQRWLIHNHSYELPFFWITQTQLTQTHMWRPNIWHCIDSTGMSAMSSHDFDKNHKDLKLEKNHFTQTFSRKHEHLTWKLFLTQNVKFLDPQKCSHEWLSWSFSHTQKSNTKSKSFTITLKGAPKLLFFYNSFTILL